MSKQSPFLVFLFDSKSMIIKQAACPASPLPPILLQSSMCGGAIQAVRAPGCSAHHSALRTLLHLLLPFVCYVILGLLALVLI